MSGRKKLHPDCAGKVSFDSAALAHEVVKGRKSRGRRNAYRCDVCGKWHVGGQKRTAHMNLRRRWAVVEAVPEIDDGAVA